jgi:hypothetical protein
MSTTRTMQKPCAVSFYEQEATYAVADGSAGHDSGVHDCLLWTTHKLLLLEALPSCTGWIG